MTADMVPGKTCYKCKHYKDSSEFYRRQGKLHSYCKECVKTQSRDSYKHVPKDFNDRQEYEAWRLSEREQDTPCVGCGTPTNRYRPRVRNANCWACMGVKKPNGVYTSVTAADYRERQQTIREARMSPVGVAIRLLTESSQKGECLFTSELGPDGYSEKVATGNGKSDRAHRVVYRAMHGEIPQDYEVHHVCARRACINPKHLEALPYRENRAEMKERKWYRNRIAALEAALSELAPDHSLLQTKESGVFTSTE